MTFVLACKVVVLLGPLKPIHIVHSMKKKNEETNINKIEHYSYNIVCAQCVEIMIS